MRLLLSIALLGLSLPGFAANLVDCGKKSLQDAIDKASPGDAVTFTGVCAGPVAIRTGNLSLTGAGSAIIDGAGQTAVVIYGAHGVSLTNVEIRNGLYGILGQNGAALAIDGVTSHANTLSGISLQTGSGAVISNTVTKDNGLHGLDLQTGSSAGVTGALTSTGNRVFGINVNGSSITFSQATVTASANALGMQVATAANAFLNDAQTTLNMTNNLATGLTVVSGAHMVSFGGKINAAGNGFFGISVNSKGGLDLDAGSVVTVDHNQGGGVAIQEQSVMTVFNNPQFSQVNAFSTLNVHDNTGSGVAVLTASAFTMATQSQLGSTANTGSGLAADNGAAITTRNTTLTGNTGKDLQLTFGARADLSTGTTFGTVSCDATVLVRGVTGLTCPK